jgi:hypothetical protein
MQASQCAEAVSPTLLAVLFKSLCDLECFPSPNFVKICFPKKPNGVSRKQMVSPKQGKS